MGPVAEDLADEAREEPARAGLDKDPRAGLVHRLDLLGEPDLADELIGQQPADRLRVGRVAGRRHVAKDREPGGPDVEPLEGPPEPLARAGHQGAVERGGDGQGGARQPRGLQRRGGASHPRPCPADDHLPGAVVVGDPDPVASFDRPRHRVAVGVDGPHQAGVVALALAEPGEHGLRPRRREGREGRLVEAAGHAQRHQLAVAVPGRHRRPDAERAQEPRQGQPGGPEGGLRHVGGLNRLGGGGPPAVIERGRGEHELAEPAVEAAVEHRVGLRERVGDLGERDRQVAEHVRELRPLPREQEGQRRARPQRLGGVIDPRRHRAGGGAALDQRPQRGEPVGQLRQAGGDDRGGPGGARHGAPAVQGGRQVEQRRPRRPVTPEGLAHLRREPADPRREVRGRPAREGEQLGRTGLTRQRPWGGAGLVLVLLQDGVEVRPAEPEGRDPGPPRVPAPDPRPRLAVEVERPADEPRLRVRRLDVQSRGQGAEVEGQGRLDEPHDPRARLGVPDHRLDAPQRDATGAGPVAGEGLGQRATLGGVADGGAGPVRLDQSQGRRAEPRLRVGPTEGAPLAVGAGGGQPLAPAVRAAGDGPDHGVDPVPVPLGVPAALEDHGRQPLADRDPVGAGVERPRPTPRRQGPALGEAEVAEGALGRVAAPHDRQVADPGRQLAAGHRDGRQRRRAGRVDRVVRAPQVEPVADPAGDHVRQDAREAVLRPPGELRPPREVGLVEELRQEGAEDVLRAQFGQAPRDPEDDAGARLVGVNVPVAGVAQRPVDQLQREQLPRLDAGEGGRRDAEPRRADRDGVEEPAPAAVDPVGGRAVGVEPAVDLEPARGDLADQVAAGQGVVPELGHRTGPGEQAGHPDDRDVERRRRRLGGLGGGARPGGGRREPGGGAVADVLVQRPDGASAAAERGELADHVHPLAALALPVQGVERAPGRRPPRRPRDPLGRDPEPAQAEPLQLVADLPRGPATAPQVAPRVLERPDELRRRAPDGVPGAELDQGRPVGPQRHLLEPADDRPGADDLLGEQVGGAEQGADLNTLPHQGFGQRRDHGAARRVVDAAGEQDVDLRLLRRREARPQEGVGHALPEDEAAPRPDVPAALAPLEDEPTGPVPQERFEHQRRRDVQVRDDPLGLPRRRLVGAAAGDDREGGLHLPDDRHLPLADRRVDEPEDADAPGARPHHGPGPPHQVAHRALFHEREGQEREPAPVGHGPAEIGDVADPGHRPLDHRVLGPV